MILPSILGIILSCIQYSESHSDVVLLPLFCLFISLWSTILVVQWKRKNAEYAYNWGTYKYETNDEHIRPDYKGNTVYNDITQMYQVQYPAYKRRLKQCITLLVLLSIAASMATVMIVLFTWRSNHIPQVNTNNNNINNQSLTSRIISLFNADAIIVPLVFGFIIPIADILVTILCNKLSEWENCM